MNIFKILEDVESLDIDPETDKSGQNVCLLFYESFCKCCHRFRLRAFHMHSLAPQITSHHLVVPATKLHQSIPIKLQVSVAIVHLKLQWQTSTNFLMSSTQTLKLHPAPLLHLLKFVHL